MINHYLYRPINFIVVLAVTTLVFTGFWSCQKDFNNSSTYLGGSIKIDEGYYLPLNTFLTWSQDSVRLSDLTTAEEDRFSMFIKGDTLHIDTLKYADNTFEFNGDLFQYRKPYTVTLFPPIFTELNQSRIELRNLLQSSSWEKGNTKITFKSGGVVFMQEDQATFSEKRCWSLREYDGLFFLVVHGSLLNCENVSYPTYQIIEAETDRIKVRYMVGETILTETWSSSQIGATERVDSFQLCNPNLNINIPSHHYYYQKTALRGGHYTIKKFLDRGFFSRNNGFTGTIRIRFVVNCLGRTGLFEAASFAPDYSLVATPPVEESWLMELTKEMGPWQPGTYQGAGEVPIDSYIFIAYKLKDGKVVDILP